MRRVKRRKLRISIVALATLLALPDGANSECVPRHRADLPVDVDHGLPIVSVFVNGHRSKLILDTGAEQTLIGTSVAQALGVQVHQEYPKSMRGLNGTLPTGTADVTVSAGGTTLTRLGVQVGPLSLPPLGYVTPDGLLGADILSQFEVDLDLPHELLHLYEPAPSCVVTGAPWPRPYTIIAANRSLHERLFFPLILDGNKLTGIFDTGSQRSVIDKTAAQKIENGRIMNDPAASVRGVTAGEVSAAAHRFGRLVLGTEELANPTLVITPLSLDDANMIVGMDYLKWHRVWLSYESHQIFVK